jgi:hypothetical protein
MQREVEKLAARLGCAVLVEDPRHRPFWWSTQGDVDEVRMRTILRREAPPAAAALVTRLGLARAEGAVRTPALPEADMAERWCVPLRKGRQLLGYLWVLDADARVAERDLGPVLRCARLAAEQIDRARPSDERRARRRRLLLTRLRTGPDPSAARELIDLEELAAEVTVVVDTPRVLGGWSLGENTSVQVDPAPGSVHTSGAPVALADLHVAVARAAATARVLRAGARLTAPSWDALGGWRLIVAAPPELAPGQIHPDADILLARRHLNLLRTARCVLDNGGDVTISARELHVHRTTVYYRLERIEALTGVNLRLAAGRDDLHLALRLAAYRQAG